MTVSNTNVENSSTSTYNPILKSLMARVQTQKVMKYFKNHKELETQSIWLKFLLFVLWAKANPEFFLICILITCSLPNMASHSQNDCLAFKLKWQDVAKCLEY